MAILAGGNEENKHSTSLRLELINDRLVLLDVRLSAHFQHLGDTFVRPDDTRATSLVFQEVDFKRDLAEVVAIDGGIKIQNIAKYIETFPPIRRHILPNEILPPEIGPRGRRRTRPVRARRPPSADQCR